MEEMNLKGCTKSGKTKKELKKGKAIIESRNRHCKGVMAHCGAYIWNLNVLI